MEQGTKNLITLYKHMRDGKLAHERFDFAVINQNVSNVGDYIYPQENECGTNGCMLGELPHLFPKTFTWGSTGQVLPETTEILKFFGLKEDEYETFFMGSAFDHIFIPAVQSPEKYGGVLLSEFATREEVTENLRQYLLKCREVTENDLL